MQPERNIEKRTDIRLCCEVNDFFRDTMRTGYKLGTRELPNGPKTAATRQRIGI